MLLIGYEAQEKMFLISIGIHLSPYLHCLYAIINSCILLVAYYIYHLSVF